jgi:hypothetical protein
VLTDGKVTQRLGIEKWEYVQSDLQKDAVPLKFFIAFPLFSSLGKWGSPSIQQRTVLCYDEYESLNTIWIVK